MTKNEVGGVSTACTLGEIAEIIVASEEHGLFGAAGLYARTLNNTPANEAAIRGF